MSEYTSTPDPVLLRLVERWRKDAAQYQKQIDEAREKNLECRTTEGIAGALRVCASELEKAVKP